ncbi:hypothetical protein [Azoarcus sp. CIB]|nr:hypothetical protein [Azoarcus sp. CIB]
MHLERAKTSIARMAMGARRISISRIASLSSRRRTSSYALQRAVQHAK